MKVRRIRIAIIIELVLLLLVLTANLLALFNEVKVPVMGTVLNIVQIFVCILAGYYVIKDYEKPHGNLLRIVMLCFSFIVGIRVVVLYFLPTITNIMTVCAAIIIAYKSGRLHKYEEMKCIVLIVSLLLAFVGITSLVIKNNEVQNLIVNFEVFCSAFTPVFIWMALFGAYFVRYAEHKEAGYNADR